MHACKNDEGAVLTGACNMKTIAIDFNPGDPFIDGFIASIGAR